MFLSNKDKKMAEFFIGIFFIINLFLILKCAYRAYRYFKGVFIKSNSCTEYRVKNLGLMFVFTSLTYVLVKIFFIALWYEDPKSVLIYSAQEVYLGEYPSILKRPLLTFINGQYKNDVIFHNYDEYRDFHNSILSNNSENVGVLLTQSAQDSYDNEYGNEFVNEARNRTDYNDEPSDVVAPGVHSVSGYTRSDGKYVESYLRTNPDGIKENNFSYRSK